MTTSINSSNSAIRQINQTTTLCTKPNILPNNSIDKGKSPNIIHISAQSNPNHHNLISNQAGNLNNAFTKNCKNSNKSNNESKIITTTLIAKQPNVNKINNTTNLKKNTSSFKNVSVKSENNNENIHTLKMNSNFPDTDKRIDDQKKNFVFEKAALEGNLF